VLLLIRRDARRAARVGGDPAGNDVDGQVRDGG
jgi:hypothetical protein